MINPRTQLGTDWKQTLRDEHATTIEAQRTDTASGLAQRQTDLERRVRNMLQTIGFDPTRAIIDTHIDPTDWTKDITYAGIDNIGFVYKYDFSIGHELHIATSCDNCGAERYSETITSRQQLAEAFVWYENPDQHDCPTTDAPEPKSCPRHDRSGALIDSDADCTNLPTCARTWTDADANLLNAITNYIDARLQARQHPA